MWCPEGYLRWAEFKSACVSELVDIFRAKLGVPADFPYEGEPFERAVKAANLARATANTFLMSAVHKTAFFCCSAEGKCMRVDTRSFLAFDLRDGPICAKEESTFQAMLWNSFSGAGDPPSVWLERNLDPKIVFLDWETGIISPPPFDVEQFNLLQLERIDNSEDEPNSSLQRRFKLSWQQAMTLASRFDGWALCIKEDDFWSLFVEMLGRFTAPTDRAEEQGDGQNSIGRPRQREKYVRVYREIFPNGHGSLQWKQVIREIENQTGLIATSVSIKRGLKDLRQNPEQNPEQNLE